MTRSGIGKKGIAALLIALLVFHVVHIYTAWAKSRIEIVEAVYDVPPILGVEARRAPQSLELILNNRLERDQQILPGFRPSVWQGNGTDRIHVSFAARMPHPEQTLNRFSTDLYASFRSSLAPAGPAVACSCTSSASSVSGDGAGLPRLLSWNTRFDPWFKPLDILSLAILLGALLLWTRSGDEKHSPDH